MDAFADLCVDADVSRRSICSTCSRPSSVCWCQFLPKNKLNPESTVVVLQHPGERRRVLRTVPMLALSLEQEKCHVYIGKHFPTMKHKGLKELLTAPDTVVLFPGPNAIPLSPELCRPSTLVLLDGTWPQAKAMLASSPLLQNIQQVCVPVGHSSEYVIRTQPGHNCMSTLEAAAYALSTIERQPEICALLLKPLQALCKFQMEHGAVQHQSKADLVEKGVLGNSETAKKVLGRRTRRLMARVGASGVSVE